MDESENPEIPSLNEVVLVGRVSVEPEERQLPSGDQVVTLRLVVDRPPTSRATGSRRQVDVIDVACWTKRVQRTARTLQPDEVVRVEGALRRRFFPTAGGRASRYEVEAAKVNRAVRSPRRAAGRAAS
jgi:single-strand DNA-binding protein